MPKATRNDKTAAKRSTPKRAGAARKLSAAELGKVSGGAVRTAVAPTSIRLPSGRLYADDDSESRVV